MWILVAIVCQAMSTESCDIVVWPNENFINEKQCAEVALKETPALASRYAYTIPRCIQVPGIDEPT
jgi:hypothetical protein